MDVFLSYTQKYCSQEGVQVCKHDCSLYNTVII